MNDTVRVRVELEIELDSIEALERLFVAGRAGVGATVEVGPGIIAELRDAEEGAGFADAVLVSIAVSFAVGTLSSLVANAIYDALGSAIRRLSVDKRRVRPTREELERALETVRLLREHKANVGDEEK